MSGAGGRRARPAPITRGIEARRDRPRPPGRPDPVSEIDGRAAYEIEGAPLFVGAAAARAAVDLLVAEGLLVEEAVDDHDVRKHYCSGAALIDDFGGKERRLPPEALPALRTLTRGCVVRSGAACAA